MPGRPLETREVPAPERAAAAGAETHRCKRCRKPITPDEYDRFFVRTGLCFWCAYVDPQG